MKFCTTENFPICTRKLSSPGFYTCALGTSGTWQVALVKLTCHPRLRPFFQSLDKWQLVKSSCQVNLKGDPPKITYAICLKDPPQEEHVSFVTQLIHVWDMTPVRDMPQCETRLMYETWPMCETCLTPHVGGGSGHGHWPKKKVKIDHFLFFSSNFLGVNDVIGASCVAAKYQQQKCSWNHFAIFSTSEANFDLAVLLRRWWILRNNLYVDSPWGETCLLLFTVCSCLFISIFNSPCCPCEQSVRDWLYRKKNVGGGLCHGHISHLVHPNTLSLDKLEHAKMSENLANTFSDVLAILKLFF